MSTKYSKKKSGDKYISRSKPRLQVKELASRDGADTLFYDKRLNKYLKRCVELLEQVYGYEDIKIIVSGCYRTKAHNAKIGGAKASKHLTGSAIDHKYTGVKKGNRVDIPSKIVCGCYQMADCRGIEMIDSLFVHVDVGRFGIWYAKKRGKSYPTVSTFFMKTNPRPEKTYRGKKYEIFGYRVIGNKYRLRFNEKLKWIRGT